MLDALALLIVMLAGLYLVVLGALATGKSARAARFLLGFAQTASLHYLELGVRLIVGWAFVWHAEVMALATIFTAFGWLLLVTTAGLALVPWRWHQRFARHAVERALSHLRVIGIASFAFGALILACAATGFAGRPVGERVAPTAQAVDIECRIGSVSATCR